MKHIKLTILKNSGTSRNHRHERWFSICKKLEGLPRHTSLHVAGIIINDHPLYEYAPLTKGDTGLLTQWTMTQAERIGLLKIDFLGLSKSIDYSSNLNTSQKRFRY